MFGPVTSQSGRAPGAVGAELGVVGDEAAAGAPQRRLDHRMPAADDARSARSSPTSGRTQSSARASSASAAATSISASALRRRPERPGALEHRRAQVAEDRRSISSAWPPAFRIFVSISASASVVKRIAFAVVCRCTKSSASGGFSIRSAWVAGVSMK